VGARRVYVCRRTGERIEQHEPRLVPDGDGGFELVLKDVSGRHLRLTQHFKMHLQAARDRGFLLSMPPYLDEERMSADQVEMRLKALGAPLRRFWGGQVCSTWRRTCFRAQHRSVGKVQELLRLRGEEIEVGLLREVSPAEEHRELLAQLLLLHADDDNRVVLHLQFVSSEEAAEWCRAPQLMVVMPGSATANFLGNVMEKVYADFEELANLSDDGELVLADGTRRSEGRRHVREKGDERRRLLGAPRRARRSRRPGEGAAPQIRPTAFGLRGCRPCWTRSESICRLASSTCGKRGCVWRNSVSGGSACPTGRGGASNRA